MEIGDITTIIKIIFFFVSRAMELLTNKKELLSVYTQNKPAIRSVTAFTQPGFCLCGVFSSSFGLHKGIKIYFMLI